MARSPLTVVDRARGLLVGLAAGHATGLDLARGVVPVAPAPPAAPEAGNGAAWGDHVALALGLAEELLEVEVDLRRLTGRWIAWWRADGRGLDQETAAALDHLARHDAPMPDGAPGTGAGWMARTLPIALVAWQQPRNLVSGTWHTVRLGSPDPLAAWAAVAVNVAAAQFMAGRRDFLPEVLEALKANDAPPSLLGLLRRIPFIGPDELQPADAHPAAAGAELVLWLAYHDPNLPRAVARGAARPSLGPTLAATLGGVLGARDGEGAVPAEWVAGLADPDQLRGLAKRLVGARTTL